MSDYPAMPLFCEPLLADTDHLTDCEFGLYMRMLAKLWLAPQQRFPNDDAWLARKFRRSPEQIRTDVRPLIEEFFRSDGNHLYHKRIDKEFAHVKKTTSERSASGKARWDSTDRRRAAALTRSGRMAEARKKGTHTKQEWEALKAIFDECVICGTKEYPLEKDHVIPVYQGGSDGIENIQPCCARCNARKGPENTDWRILKNPDWITLLAQSVGYMPLKLQDFDACKRSAPTPTLTPTLIEEESIPPTESVTPSEPEMLAGKPASRYAWEGQVIRLTARDLKSWRAVGRDLDLEAYLFKRDLWLASLPADDARRKKWFVGTGTDLANSQQRAAAEKAMQLQARGKIDNRHEEANRRRLAEERATDAGLSPYSPEWMQFASQAMKGGLVNGQQHRAA